MKLRIQEAMDLLRWKTKKNKKQVNWQWLGLLIYNKEDYPRTTYGSVANSMQDLKKGIKKMFSFDSLTKMCRALMVDPNFLFGWPSIHDKEYKKMIEEKEKVES